MDKKESLDFIIQFAKDIDLHDDWEITLSQVRAFFTTWCFVNQINADTKECDDALYTIFYQAGLERFVDKDTFDNAMLELLV